jgi:hypothetical protein
MANRLSTEQTGVSTGRRREPGADDEERAAPGARRAAASPRHCGSEEHSAAFEQQEQRRARSQGLATAMPVEQPRRLAPRDGRSWCKAPAFGDLPSVARLPVWGQGGGILGIGSARFWSPGVPARRARDRRCAVALGRRLRDDRAGGSRPLRGGAGADEQHRRETGRQRISRLGRRRHPPDRTRDNLSKTETVVNLTGRFSTCGSSARRRARPSSASGRRRCGCRARPRARTDQA